MALHQAVGPAQRCPRAGRQVDGHPRRQRDAGAGGRGHARRRQATRQVAATNAPDRSRRGPAPRPQSSARGEHAAPTAASTAPPRHADSPRRSTRRPPPRRRGSTGCSQLGQHGVAHCLAVGAAELEEASRPALHPPPGARHDRAATMGRWTTTRAPADPAPASGGWRPRRHVGPAPGGPSASPFSAAALAVVGAGVVAVAAGSRARRPARRTVAPRQAAPWIALAM